MRVTGEAPECAEKCNPPLQFHCIIASWYIDKVENYSYVQLSVSNSESVLNADQESLHLHISHLIDHSKVVMQGTINL